MMSLMQEAQTLLQAQPESNLQLIVSFLRAISPNQTGAVSSHQNPREGCIGGLNVNLPPDFHENFIGLDEEIAAMF